MKFIDDWLDRVTMYRLVVYYLGALLAAAFVFSFFKLLPHDPTALAFSSFLILVVCWVSNWAFSLVFKTPANVEFVYITALILILIISPVTAADMAGTGAMIFASVWAIASKFVLAIGKKHLFNPAALGVALTAVLLNLPATWWVAGNLMLMPLVVVGGLLIVRKLQRFDLVLSFIAANLAAVLATTTPDSYGDALMQTITYSPLFFFGFVMLTEPMTAPQARWPRIAFGALVGILSAPNIHLGDYYLTPEVALLVGNLFAYAVSPKGKFALTLLRIEQAANGAYDFIFRPDRRLAFEPGQYLEWTLGFPHADNRGNRRQFTIASAPTEEEVRLGVRFYPRSSTFKRALGEMRPGDTIFAAQLAGSFVLPRNEKTKLAFIAGGIGITPFRSMLQYLIDTGQTRPIVMFYGNPTPSHAAYSDVLAAAGRELGIRTVYTFEKDAPEAPHIYTGLIDAALIKHELPDFMERTFYISGPQLMVASVERSLHKLGVPRSRIKMDFFPGFAGTRP